MAENLYASTNVSQTVDKKLETRKFFNGHYIESINVNSSEHQAVKSFFLEKTQNDNDASNTLTDTMIEIGAMEKVNVMELIDKLRGETIDDIQLTLITMINQNRKQTSILGFSTSRVPNPSVVRNIVE
ncbi:hypothetical protein [Winogradskyella sp.]|jgi:hypothetical protein|uniref:hypothetical protein n=1 Tax=Winogradskyella sp. TaxID=1883156 RepID=UPI0035136E22